MDSNHWLDTKWIPKISFRLYTALRKSREKNCVFLFRLAQKVSELLDTFKPGTFSYRPFKKPMRSIAVIDANNNR